AQVGSKQRAKIQHVDSLRDAPCQMILGQVPIHPEPLLGFLSPWRRCEAIELARTGNSLYHWSGLLPCESQIWLCYPYSAQNSPRHVGELVYGFSIICLK